jgi:hypothetical protein
MSARPVLAPDAAIALGIASTAMPFARTPQAQAERWLRVLRLHGKVGIALQALGVSEQPLPGDGARAGGESAGERVAAGEPARGERPTATAVGNGGADDDAVARVTAYAVRVADRRRARALATTDILMAVMHVYGEDFDRVLRVHGTDREEVLERLGLASL